MHPNCHMCGHEKMQNWYFLLCEPHKKEHREKKKRERAAKKCENGNHMWATTFHAGIERKRCNKCGKVKIPSYLDTGLERRTNSFSIYTRMGKLVKRFPRKYRRFEELYYSGRVANLIYWLRYEKNWTAEKIETTFKIPPEVLNSFIYIYTWRKGDKYLSERDCAIA